MKKNPEFNTFLLDNARLSLPQYKFAVFCFIQSSVILISAVVTVAKNNVWEAVILATILSVPAIFVFSSLMSNFPNQNLFQINQLVYGKVAGKIISAVYLWAFLTLTSLNLRDLGDFVSFNILPRTPPIVIVAVFIFVCALPVRHGLAIVTKFASFISVTTAFITAITIILVSRLINLSNLLPIFDLTVAKYLQSANIIATIPFCELYIFLMITPNIKFDKAEIKKATFTSFFAGAAYFLIVALRDTSVHGNAISLFKFPSFETHKLIGLTEYRADILFGMSFVVFSYYKVSLLYYITVQAIAQLFNLKAHKPIVLITGALAATYSLTLFESSTDHAATQQQTTPFAWIIIEVLLPLVTLLLAKVRKLPQKSGGGNT